MAVDVSKAATTERPVFVTDEHLRFLDDLRTSGVTNMYGASIYLESEFGLSHDKAVKVLSCWMRTFSNRGCPKGSKEWKFCTPTTSLNIRREKEK